LSLFSVAWPLTPCCFLINNWVEVRSDALKIAIGSKRPIPWRADSIGAWVNALGFLSWLGSLTSTAIVALCRGRTNNAIDGSLDIKAWTVLLSVLLAEHLYLIVQLAVRHIMNKIDSPGIQKERKERYIMKKKLLQQHLGENASEKALPLSIETSEKITKATLEDEAREASKHGQGAPEDL
jgi:anoctamin-10